LETLRKNFDFNSSDNGSNPENESIEDREYKRINTMERMHAFMDKREQGKR